VIYPVFAFTFAANTGAIKWITRKTVRIIEKTFFMYFHPYIILTSYSIIL